jgi:hypothetical protein
MTYWNYRVVNVQDEPEGEPFYEICEVFYDENDDPAGWTKANASGEDIQVLTECMKLMAKALNQPTLEPEDFIGKFYEHEGELH